MSTKQDLKRRLNELFDDIEQYGYKRGWQDAIKSVMSAAQERGFDVASSSVRTTRARLYDVNKVERAGEKWLAATDRRDGGAGNPGESTPATQEADEDDSEIPL